MEGMKTVITKLVFVAMLSNVVQCEELRFDLLHQSDYDVKIERVELIWYNNSYFKDFKLNYVLYNRTQRVFNASGNFLMDLSDDLTADYQLYKFMSNEYRFFPITVSINLCKEYGRNSFGIKVLLDQHSNIRSCPPKKGYYNAYNAVLDYSRWPPFIPRGAYKAELKVYDKSDFIAEGHGYGTIKDKPLKWSN